MIGKAILGADALAGVAALAGVISPATEEQALKATRGAARTVRTKVKGAVASATKKAVRPRKVSKRATPR